MILIHVLWAALIAVTMPVAVAQDLDVMFDQCRRSKDPHLKLQACSFVIQTSKNRSQIERAYNSRGLANMALTQFSFAVQDFSEAIKRDKKNAGYVDNRQGAFFALGQYDRAFADAHSAVELAPRQAFVYASRARLFDALGVYDRGIADYSMAFSLDQKWIDLLVDRGKSYAKSGKYDAAASDFGRAIEIDPNFVWAFRERGLLFKKLGFREKAYKDLEIASRALTDDKEITDALSELKGVASAPSVDTPIKSSRVALIIGNSRYQYTSFLRNAVNDAQALASALRSIGFSSVFVKTELNREQIISALREFAKIADTADWAMFYYSGHGIEFGGTNYVIPVDAQLKVDRDIELETVDVGKVLSAIEGARKFRLVVLDACRQNPFLSQMRRTMASRSLGRGLASIEPEPGTLIVYAAKHGEIALDGDGLNSPFVSALLTRISTPGLEIRRLFDLVRDDVLDATGRKQQPFSYGSLSGSQDYYFVAK